MKIFILISIIIILEFVAKKSAANFKGFIMCHKNGMFVPDIRNSYQGNKKLFWQLAKPYLAWSSIEIVFIILLIVELLR